MTKHSLCLRYNYRPTIIIINIGTAVTKEDAWIRKNAEWLFHFRFTRTWSIESSDARTRPWILKSWSGANPKSGPKLMPIWTLFVNQKCVDEKAVSDFKLSLAELPIFYTLLSLCIELQVKTIFCQKSLNIGISMVSTCTYKIPFGITI